PQRLQPRAKRALHEMMYAERRADCEAARSRFEAEYQAKYPEAVESLTANCERLVGFFDFPAEHWKHLRTTSVIESPFATVRLRERATRGAGSRTNGLLMAFKLADMARLHWRRSQKTCVNAIAGMVHRHERRTRDSGFGVRCLVASVRVSSAQLRLGAPRWSPPAWG